MRKAVLLIAALLTVIGLLVAGRAAYRAWKQREIYKLAYIAYGERAKHLEEEYAIVKTPGHTVIFGDSFIMRWMFYPGLWTEDRWVNRGVNGNMSDQILQRVNRYLVSAKPGCLVWLGGINDYGYRRPYGESEIRAVEEQILANTGAAIDACKAKGVRIIIFSLLPVVESRLSRSAWPACITNHHIEAMNQKLKSLCCEKGVPFIDAYSSFSWENRPRGELFCYDGIHLSRAGYTVLHDLLAAQLQKSQ